MLPAACMFMVQALTTTQLYGADVLMVVMVMRVAMVPAVVVMTMVVAAVVVVTMVTVVVTRVVVMTMMVPTDLKGSDPQLISNWCQTLRKNREIISANCRFESFTRTVAFAALQANVSIVGKGEGSKVRVALPRVASAGAAPAGDSALLPSAFSVPAC